MRRFLLFFSYIGTGFRGVQRLVPRNVKTNLIHPAVTEVIEDALKTRLNLEKLPTLCTASRTDAGVHALRTAATVDLNLTKLRPEVITVTLNHYFGQMQCPIRILSTQVVKDTFSARHLPISRSYLYRFAVQKSAKFESDYSFTHFVPTPISEYKRCHFVHDSDFDADAVRAVLPLFVGYQDFASFQSKNRGRPSDEPTTTFRRLDNVTLEEGRPLLPSYADQFFDYWQVRVIGKSYLYKQIRRTLGVILGVGQGVLNYSDVKSLFDNPGTWHDRIRSLPPHGLYLTDVIYNEDDLVAPTSEDDEPRSASPKDLSELSVNERINLRDYNLRLARNLSASDEVRSKRKALTVRRVVQMGLKSSNKEQT